MVAVRRFRYVDWRSSCFPRRFGGRTACLTKLVALRRSTKRVAVRWGGKAAVPPINEGRRTDGHPKKPARRAARAVACCCVRATLGGLTACAVPPTHSAASPTRSNTSPANRVTRRRAGFARCASRSRMCLTPSTGSRIRVGSRNRFPNDDRSGREDPRTVLVIGDPLDSAVCAHFDPNDSRDLPRAIVEMQKNDPGLTIDVAHSQPPRHPHARIDAELTAIREAARVPIGDEQSGVGADQFAEPVPVLAIEPLDVQAKDLLILLC